MASEINNEEVNYLVFRYLQESGFRHSAFTFACESGADKTDVDPAAVPLGALIAYLQKGLYYQSIETHLHEDGTLGGTRCTAGFSLLTPHICDAQSDTEDRHRVGPASASDDSDDERPEAAKPTKRPRHGSSASAASAAASAAATADAKDVKAEPASDNASAAAAAAAEREKCFHFANETATTIAESAVTPLLGHTKLVFACSWSRTGLLATGSGDGTARVWDTAVRPTPSCRVLQHPAVVDPSAATAGAPATAGNQTEVSVVEWSPDDKWLATSGSDGVARIWSARGELQRVLKRHNGTVFSLQWSPSGRHLLTGGVDRSSIVWDAERGEVAQQFTNHTAAVLDVAWRDDTSFVSCSSDKTIFAYELGRTLPVRHLIGHTNDVNAVEWDPTRTVLASCSDDKTARLWRLSQDQCLHTLSDHTKEIYSIQWSPACAAYSPILATASFDSYVKLWNPETGLVTNTLAMHTDHVYRVCFSHSGDYLASGSRDCRVCIWSVKTGKLVRSFRGPDTIFDVCWSADDSQIAACYSTHSASIIDLRK